jgi:excisionase family DNA binding protein
MVRVTRPESAIQPILVTVEEAAKLLSLGRTTMYQLIDKEDVPVHRFKSSIRINPEELEQWLKKRDGIQA